MTPFHAQKVEATTGFEPVNRGFADLRVEPLHHVARWVRRRRDDARMLAAPRGFEPRFTDSKSAVLPLDEGATAAAGSISVLRVNFANETEDSRQRRLAPGVATLDVASSQLRLVQHEPAEVAVAGDARVEVDREAAGGGHDRPDPAAAAIGSQHGEDQARTRHA